MIALLFALIMYAPMAILLTIGLAVYYLIIYR